jgi:hypothetical protein
MQHAELSMHRHASAFRDEFQHLKHVSDKMPHIDRATTCMQHAEKSSPTEGWKMFGPYDMRPGGGVNPPYSPAYPMEWEAELRTLEVVTRVDRAKLETLLADTPFELVNDRVASATCSPPATRSRSTTAGCST